MDKVTEVELKLDGLKPTHLGLKCSGSTISECKGELWPIVNKSSLQPRYYHLVCERHIKELGYEPSSFWRVYRSLTWTK
jgi:hypothetical protein